MGGAIEINLRYTQPDPEDPPGRPCITKVKLRRLSTNEFPLGVLKNIQRVLSTHAYTLRGNAQDTYIFNYRSGYIKRVLIYYLTSFSRPSQKHIYIV